MTLIIGVVILVVTIASLRAVLPKAGKNYHLVDRPSFGVLIPLAITVGFALGIAFVIAGLV